MADRRLERRQERRADARHALVRGSDHDRDARAARWQPRTTLLSPFDNLIADRARSELVFDLSYRMEIYVPKEKRRFGYYAMPVLDGDRFVALVDPAMDRANGRLVIRAVHAAPETTPTAEVWGSVARAVGELAGWLGATDIDVDGHAPAAFRRALR